LDWGINHKKQARNNSEKNGILRTMTKQQESKVVIWIRQSCNI